MRKFSKSVTENAKVLLSDLVARPEPIVYRRLMSALGKELGFLVGGKLSLTDKILLICTNEDADFLATGLLNELESKGYNRIALACFWNDRKQVFKGIDVAPITKRYIEPSDYVDVFIVVKSSISTACVVRTVISELVDEKTPRRILVVAPVIYSGATKSLEEEFEKSTVDKFEYYWFAEDDQRKDNGDVLPGIGGSVYELLGVGDSTSKNQYTPELVKQRLSSLSKP